MSLGGRQSSTLMKFLLLNTPSNIMFMFEVVGQLIHIYIPSILSGNFIQNMNDKIVHLPLSE